MGPVRFTIIVSAVFVVALLNWRYTLFLRRSDQIVGSMSWTKIENLVALDSRLAEAEISSSFLNWVNLRRSSWTNVKVRDGRLWELEWDHAVLRNVVFDGVDLRGIRFRNTTFVDCVFRDSKLTDVTFINANLERTRFERTDCDYCDFRSANFTDSSIDRPFTQALYNETSRLPIHAEQLANFGFSYRSWD